jgi:urease
MQVEGTFATGTHLITIHCPISTDDGDMKLALYGSYLPAPADDLFPKVNTQDYEPSAMPGAIRPAESADIVLYQGRPRKSLTVVNKGTRAVHVSILAVNSRALALTLM